MNLFTLTTSEMCLYEILEVIYVPEINTTVHIRDAVVKVRHGLIKATKLCLTEKYFTLLPLFCFFFEFKIFIQKMYRDPMYPSPSFPQC